MDIIEFKSGVIKRMNACYPRVILNTLRYHDVFLAGGAAKSLFTGETINDYDLFFQDEQALKITIYEMDSAGFKNIFSCPEGKLYSYKLASTKIQLICPKYYKDAKTLIDSFDFTCTQFCIHKDKNKIGDECTLTTYANSLRDARNKILNINKVQYPAATLKRITKYANRGYKVPPYVYSDITNRLYNRSHEIEDSELVYID